MTLSQEYVRKLFEYRGGKLYHRLRPATNRFNKTFNTKYGGKEAGSVMNTGYIEISTPLGRFLAHRVIFLYHHGWLPDVVDHEDCNPQNNHVENLRPATTNQNMHNSRKRVTNTSGHKCVYWKEHAGKWQVQICVNRKQIHCGYFDSLEEAADVAKRERAKYHNTFARDE